MATWVINGNTYSDDSTPGTRNLDNDGHRENFPLLCTDIGTVAGQVSSDKATVAADKATVAADKATVAADKATVAADKATVAADKATTEGYRDTASTHAGTATTKAAEAAASALAASGSAATAASEAGDAADAAAAAEGYRDTASTHASTASTKAAEAAASAVTAVNAPGTNASSTTSLSVGTGPKSLTIQTGKAFVVGMSVKIASTAGPGNWMAGDITAYNSGTGALTVNSVLINGSGTVADWTVSLCPPVSASSGSVTSGANTFTDDQTILAAGGNGLILNTVASSSSPEIATTGADTDVPLLLSTKGAASLRLRTNATVEQFRIGHTASAVDYFQATGAATGGSPDLSVQGSDTNIGATFSTKGTGNFGFRTNTNVEQFRVAHTASAVNLLSVTGAVASSPPDLAAIGSDANIGINFSTKGTGAFSFRTATNVTQFEVTNTVSAVNRLRATGAATGAGPVLSAQGSDTNIGAGFASKGTGALSFYTNGAVEQLRVAHTASAVDYIQITGAATGGTVEISAQGSDADVALALASKGSDPVSIRTNGTVEQLRVGHTASAVDYLLITGAAAGGAVGVSAQGTDTDVTLALASKGSDPVSIRTNGSVPQFEVAHTASAVNFIRVTGGATGAGVTISAQGSDSNIDAAFMAKGTGGIGLNVADPLPNVVDVDGAVVGNIVAMAADAMDLSLGDFFTKTINGAWSPTFSNVPTSRRVHWELVLTHTSGAITWPAAVKWPDNTAPSLTTGKTHKFFFQTHDGGTTVRASCLKNFTG